MSEEAAEPSLDALARRIQDIANECIESYAGLAKRAAGALGGEAEDRTSWYKDAWMAWAESAGHAVEAAYLSALVADRIVRPSRDRG